MKKANGDCLRGGGEQQGEGWLLAMEDGIGIREIRLPEMTKVKLSRRLMYCKRHQQNTKAYSKNPNLLIRLICEINLFSM